MKIPGSIRNLYAEQLLYCADLKNRVDALLAPRLHDRWHYESRLKEEESFALKIESGRVRDIRALEDFFAATIVVRNYGEISTAEAIVKDLFTPKERRPPLDIDTKKAPEQFTFDDLRLYVRWVDDATLPPSGLGGALFEVQIKTFLQHAWSIATHELIYKSDDASWSKMRIAYQIKAMLEHAEVSIQEAARIAESDALNKTDTRTATVKTFIQLITEVWDQQDLPSNVRRLAENVMIPARMAGVNAETLKALLLEEKKHGRGPLTLNLSPYGIVVQTILNLRRTALENSLSIEQKSALVLTRELEIPEGMRKSSWDRSTVTIA